MLGAGPADNRVRLAYPLAQGMKSGGSIAGEDDAFHEFMGMEFKVYGKS